MAELVQIAGTAIGFAIGGPIGGAIGGALGGALGRELFPADPIQGPRLESLQLTTSTIGSVINQMDGNQRLAGQVIWLNEVREVKETDEVGGLLGIGGQEVVQYRYFVDFAVGFAEGEIGAVRKIWFDNKIRYDVSEPITAESAGLPTGIFPAAFTRLSEQIAASRALDFDFYPGSDTQLPDELIESVLGMGNASAYRGLCYIVFKNVEITDTRRIPQVTAELVKKPIESGDEKRALLSKEVKAWVTGTRDPRDPCGEFEYRIPNGLDNISPTDWFATFAEVQAAVLSEYGSAVDFSRVSGWRLQPANDGNEAGATSDYEEVDPGEKQRLTLFFPRVTVGEFRRQLPFPTDGTSAANTFFYAGVRIGDDPFHWSGYRSDGESFLAPGICIAKATGTGEDDLATFISAYDKTYTTTLTLPDDPITDYIYYTDAQIQVRRKPRCPGSPCDCTCSDLVDGCPETLPEDPSYCVLPDGTILPDVTPTEVSGDFLVLALFNDNPDAVSVDLAEIQRPLGPVLDLDLASDVALNTEAFWEAAYQAALSAGLVPDDWVYDVDYPVSTTTACEVLNPQNVISSIPTTLEEVVQRICLRHQYELSEIDTTGLREIVAGELTSDHVLIDGYSIRSAISGRAQLEQLRTYGFFDAVESDGKLKFVRRGLAAITELGEDELGAFEQSRIPAISIERQQDVELPREVRVHYYSPARDYLPAEQISARLTPLARNVVDLELAIAMSDNKAKQIADVVLYDAWTERNRYSTAISNQWLRLEPTDCISVPVEGQTERLRILSVDYTLPGLLTLAAVRDDDGIYVSEAVGNGGGFVPQAPTLRGPTQAIYLDLPPLSQAHTDAGYYVAVRGLLDTWPGATILRSGDGGDTYSPARSINIAATVGSAVTALPDAPSSVADLGNTLTVDLLNGALQSISEAAWYAGGNLAALRSGEVWELLQFRTATEISAGRWELTNLLRGRRGTEHATGGHAAGDAFVLLASPALLGLDVSNVGLTLPHKAVTAGTPIANTDPQDFTPRGEALMPWTPANLQATYTDAGDIVISWQWRNRYGISLRSGATVPLSDVPEAGEVEVLIGGSVVRTIAVTSNSATYTAAQQMADSFSTGAFRVAQINPLIGRGRAAEVSL